MRCGSEILGERRELRGFGGISVLGRGGSGRLQAGGNLLCHLLVFRGVRLLKLLERAQQFGERRKLAAVGRLAVHALCAFGCALQPAAKNGSRVVGEIVID